MCGAVPHGLSGQGKLVTCLPVNCHHSCQNFSWNSALDQGENCWFCDSWCPCFYSSAVIFLPQLSWAIWAHRLEWANLWQQIALQWTSRLISPESAKSILQLLPSAQKKIGHFLWWEQIYQCSAAWRCMGSVLLFCWTVWASVVLSQGQKFRHCQY